METAPTSTVSAPSPSSERVRLASFPRYRFDWVARVACAIDALNDTKKPPRRYMMLRVQENDVLLLSWGRHGVTIDTMPRIGGEFVPGDYPIQPVMARKAAALSTQTALHLEHDTSEDKILLIDGGDVVATVGDPYCPAFPGSAFRSALETRGHPITFKPEDLKVAVRNLIRYDSIGELEAKPDALHLTAKGHPYILPASIKQEDGPITIVLPHLSAILNAWQGEIVTLRIMDNNQIALECPPLIVIV